MSPDTRPDADEDNATYRPSPLIAGDPLEPSPWTPSEDTLTRDVEPDTRSYTNTSFALFVSPATRSDDE